MARRVYSFSNGVQYTEADNGFAESNKFDFSKAEPDVCACVFTDQGFYEQLTELSYDTKEKDPNSKTLDIGVFAEYIQDITKANASEDVDFKKAEMAAKKADTDGVKGLSHAEYKTAVETLGLKTNDDNTTAGKTELKTYKGEISFSQTKTGTGSDAKYSAGGITLENDKGGKPDGSLNVTPDVIEGLVLYYNNMDIRYASGDKDVHSAYKNDTNSIGKTITKAQFQEFLGKIKAQYGVKDLDTYLTQDKYTQKDIYEVMKQINQKTGKEVFNLIDGDGTKSTNNTFDTLDGTMGSSMGNSSGNTDNGSMGNSSGNTDNGSMGNNNKKSMTSPSSTSDSQNSMPNSNSQPHATSGTITASDMNRSAPIKTPSNMEDFPEIGNNPDDFMQRINTMQQQLMFMMQFIQMMQFMMPLFSQFSKFGNPMQSQNRYNLNNVFASQNSYNYYS